MNYKKYLKKAFAVVMGISMIFSSNCIYADEWAGESETESEKYADEYKPIDFKITDLSIVASESSATIKWNIDAEKDEYITTHSVDVEIYRSVGDTSNYSRLTSINSNCVKAMSYVDSSLLAGNNYYYKVRISGYFDEVGQRVYHELDGEFVEFAYNPVKLTNPNTELSLSVNTIDDHRIRLSWYQIYANGALVSSYQVYRSESRDGKYKLISTVQNISGKTEYEYIDANTVFGKTYYYKIRAVLNGGSSYSNYSNVVTGYATIDVATILSAKSLKARTITITWKKVENASGYYVYYKQGSKGTYTLATKTANNGICSYCFGNLTNGKKYYFKVCAYMIKNGVEYTSESVKGKYCDYYGYKNESSASKYRRVFKRKKYVYYKSELIAKRHMKKITVKVWDKTPSRWYSRKFSLSVNKAIAPTVKVIFRSLYKLDEKSRRPIHDVGGFSWRGKGSTSEHNQGLAIDINANENYMITNGKVQAGSFWRPKKNLYSIPMKGKFVNVLKRYGFDRCIWNFSATEYTRDYMHFSYNGGR